MFKWIQRALTPKNRFVVPARHSRLPECCIRPFRARLKSRDFQGIRPIVGAEFVSSQCKPRLLRWSPLFRNPEPSDDDA